MALTAGSDVSSRKCARPPSASVQAQQDGSNAMKKIAHVFEDFTKSFTASMQAQITSTQAQIISSQQTNPLATVLRLLNIWSKTGITPLSSPVSHTRPEQPGSRRH
ncbi:hypothetical protein PAXRUDRAFT_21289 [Paxillus rubicundulus Ve08.2h10]|uniref:Uncharacterized protein n=1 Tax=Paxillus rubicundulus Ve08.2h10 TaxID=930991 RepID=A0A0D0CQG5_9AGAM|nr:hypothetical protein PAXRUDRAFT_21289 [Paxillus rubicundulus Ve08.2h10]